MNKHKTLLGAGVILASLVIIVLMISLVVYFPSTQVIILKILGPLVLMALFVGIFLLLSGLFQKKEEKEKK